MHAVVDWVHLLAMASFLSVMSVLQFIIVTFYTLFPFPSLLDRIFLTSKALQGWFSYRLGLAEHNELPSRLHAEAIVRDTAFKVETHTAQTKDGFILVLHRLVPRNAKQDASSRRPPVLCMHALMQDSEAFLCGDKHSLALYLASAGFDVWLGNNRGNRYSHKHVSLSPHEDEYWNFSIDELARYDLPCMVDYVLAYTNEAQLRYIGFSQGSAQAFAAFVQDHALAAKVKLFIALAAPPRARGLSHSYLSSLVSSNPRFIYLLLGRHAMLSSTLLWMKILSPELFVRVVDVAIHYLFQWSAKEVSMTRKVALYQHIFSYSSVKTVVHWFQLIRLRRLAMYQDSSSSNRIAVEYDLSRLRLPVALFYGGKDTVIDIDALVKELPNVIKLHKEDEYEHLDCIWADSALTRVFPQIVELLKRPSY